MPRVRLEVAYDGAEFCGWATQPGLRSVQETLEQALQLVLRVPCELTVAGRTDAGVHATGQVAHFDIDQDAWQAVVGRCARPPAEALVSRLAGVLPRFSGRRDGQETPAKPEGHSDVIVRGAKEVPSSFDARFSALWRAYRYRICDQPAQRSPLSRTYTWWYPRHLDAVTMDQAAQVLLGEHDFAAFCKPREGATTVRTLQHMQVQRTEVGLEISVQADAFCHSMVRSLVGALTEVGRGKRDAAWLEGMLSARERNAQIPVAPAHGLCLEAVGYPEGEQALAQRQLLTRRRRDEGEGCCRDS